MNSNINAINALLTVLTFLLITGCSNESGTDSETSSQLKTGYLINPPVSGVTFQCGELEGSTTDEGAFECIEENITFAVGNLTLGKINSYTNNQTINLHDIVGIEYDNFDNDYLAKLAILLQSLDDDGDISSHIKISESASLQLNEKKNINDLSYEELNSIISSAGKTPVFKLKALAYLRESFGQKNKIIYKKRNGELYKTKGFGDYTLVKNTNLATKSSNSRNYTLFKNLVYFTAEDADGYGLWKTDGTESGTSLVARGYAGKLTTSDNYLYYVIDEGYDQTTSLSHASIWLTDGTSLGTKKLKSFIRDGGYSVSVENLVTIDDELYFRLYSDTSNGDMWRSDGTEFGTVKTLDTDDDVRLLTSFQGNLYFIVNQELWKMDGESGNTEVVLDTQTYIGAMHASDNHLFLTGISSDGPTVESEGTWLFNGNTLNKIRDHGSREISTFHSLEERLIWSQRDRLYSSDGTQEGTITIGDDSGNDYIFNPWHSSRNSIKLNNKIYILDTNNLYITDGTQLGTAIVKTLEEIPTSTFSSKKMFAFQNKLYFYYINNNREKELLEYDPNTNGSSIIMTSSGNSDPNISSIPIVLNDQFILESYQAEYGDEIFTSNGTLAGTNIITDLNTDNASSSGSNGNSGVAVGDLYYFPSTDIEHGNELWVTDGTEEGTNLLKDLVEGRDYSYIYNFTQVEDKIYLIEQPTSGSSNLWSGNAEQGMSILEGEFNSLSSLTVMNDDLYFTASSDSYGSELWRSDNTGTQLVADINPGADDSSPWNIHATSETLFFSANNGTNGSELWKSDGTDAGTVMVKDINLEGSSSPYLAIATDDSVYFTADDGTNGRQLWVSDGTDAGTKPVIISGDLNTDFIDDEQSATFNDNVYMHLDGKLMEISGYTSQSIHSFDDYFLQGIFPANNHLLWIQSSKTTEEGDCSLQVWSYEDTTAKLLATLDVGDKLDYCPGADIFDGIYFKSHQVQSGITLITLGETWRTDVDLDILTDGTPSGTSLVSQ